MGDRFDLEQGILKCWNITDDIELLSKSVLEGDLTKDDIANFLIGLKTIYNIRFDDTFKLFETLVGQKKIL